MNMNMNKLEEVLATSKLNELIHKKEEDEKNCMKSVTLYNES